MGKKTKKISEVLSDTSSSITISKDTVPFTSDIYDIRSDIEECTGTTSRLVSSVKEMQFKERHEKRKHWINAMRFRRRYF